MTSKTKQDAGKDTSKQDKNLGKSVGRATRYKPQKPNLYTESPDMARNAAIYVRISRDEDGDGPSLSTQERMCREYIAKEKPGWKVVNVFSDEQSGKTDKRPGFMDLMDAIDEGKVNAIVCLHLDRFSRDIHDILKYFYKLEKDEVFMAFADEHFDFSTPEGKMHFHFLAVFADWYIKNLSRETKRGKKNVITEGRQNNQVPFGYLKLPEEKIPEIVPEEAEIIRQIFEMYSLGTYTDANIADWINDQGFTTRKGKAWTKDAVRTTLQLDYYYGMVKHLSVLYPGIHEPLIDKELFDRVQKVRKEHFARPRTSTKRFQRIFLLNGIVRCASCRKTLRAHGIREKYRYYREVAFLRGDKCEDSGAQVVADEVEAQVGVLVANFHLPEDWQQEIQEALDAGDRDRENKEKRRDELEAKQRRVVELYADGMISKENYEARRDRLRIQLEMLAPPNADRLISTGKKIESFAQVWRMASMVDKRDIAQMMFEWIEIDVRKSRLRYVSPKRGFQIFFDKHPMMRKDEERGGYRVVNLP
jgi:DNA invertase Pin-like site-specific DNA recombinase